MFTLEPARETARHLNALFTETQTPAIATLDPTEVTPGVHANRVIALVTAPDCTFTGQSVFEAEWEIWLIAPGAQDLETAWETLETTLEVFRQTYQVTQVKSATYQPANGASFPALICSFETVHTTNQ